MSTRTEHSAWSPDEADSLENIDKEIQLVSTSTESHSISNHVDENRSIGKEKIMSDSNSRSEPVARQSTLNTFHSKSYDNLQAITFHSPGDMTSQESSNYTNKNPNCGNVSNDVSSHFAKNTHSYDHVQSKIRQNVNSSAVKQKAPVCKSTGTVESSDKEDYLEQINKQLTKELDEKNAILTLLQENYERLLFKYAEAQNRIDELRIKFLAEKSEPKNFQVKQEFPNNHIPQFFTEDYSTKQEDIKCQKGLVTPSINLDEPPPDQNMAPALRRPSSLPLDTNLRFGERDLLKATTPTDSEGLSSIITSMSGHSKILNSLDEENQMNKKSIFKYKRNNFLLKENMSNDPFDKVKNWQNSLPPLEQIETPETTLYNVNNAYSSTGTNYKDISSPKTDKDYLFSDESCPLSWKEETRSYNERCDLNRSPMPSQSVNQFYSKKSSDDGEHFHEGNFQLNEKIPPHTNVPASSILQKRHKRPPLLRCSSLPAYDYESIRSGKCKNGIYIPPLDLNNVTLSDDESYCQQECYLNKSNGATSSSLISSSREDPVDRSIQTPLSFSSCKATISEERLPRQTISKSTSITPDRTRAMDSSLTSHDRKFEATTLKTTAHPDECNECCSDKTTNRCNVCGESIPGEKRIFGSRSNSCESVHRKDVFPKDPLTRRSKPPFKRSVSFGSCTSTPRYCSHEKPTPGEFFAGFNQDTIDNFDAYASSLRARSQAVIKALAAHVNNS